MDYRKGLGFLVKLVPVRFAGKTSAEGWARFAGIFGVVAVGMAFAQLSWRFVAIPEDSPSASLHADTSTASSATPFSISELADGHLFGLAMAQANGAINAPETTLSLTLHGIFALDSDRALAIIANGGGEELPYRIGDSVPGGAIVHEINPDKVILERDGRFETLTLPKDSLDNNSASASAAAGSSAAPASASASRLGDIRNKLKANPSEIANMNAIQPVMENGKLKGYQLEDNPYMPAMRDAGLAAGDVVTRVNGIPVTDQGRAADMINQLSNAGHIDLEVERGGVPTTLSINLGR